MEPLSIPDGARALTKTAGVRRLEDQAVLRVSGDDARSWLNGQITNDVGTPSPGRATYALVVSLKGRVLTDLWALDRGDVLDLVVPASNRNAIAAHLDRYIIMEDAEVAPLDGMAVVSVQGPVAAEVAAAVAAEGWWTCPRLGTDGRDAVVPEGEARELVERLAAAAGERGGGLVDEAAWELARVRAGVPRMGVDFGEHTYPQEAGLKERALSFRKGCYQGQEAVVMLEHRGKPPKKLVRLRIEGDDPAATGAELFDAEGRKVGQVTSCTPDPETPGECPALGHVKRDLATEGAALRVGSTPATVLTVLGG